jgi:hypothetical protein
MTRKEAKKLVVGQIAYAMRYQKSDGDPNAWHVGLWWPNRDDGSLRYAADMWDLSREASLVLQLNIDFQVQPPVESSRYTGKRLRIDDLIQMTEEDK